MATAAMGTSQSRDAPGTAINALGTVAMNCC
jgi:hypothetical protein